MSRVDDLKDELARAQRAFKQNPTPSLATSIEQITASLKYWLRTGGKS